MKSILEIEKPPRKIKGRDKRGWRIPRAGTLSRQIYDLASDGAPPAEIAAKLQHPVNSVRVLTHRFRHPDEMNAIWLIQSHRRKNENRP